ncbi:MAG: hypothetical protein JO340_01900 [Acidobacteriaceae bacterium]|nr:hypothetical protein [Acidobacteriaceae bacterium]
MSPAHFAFGQDISGAAGGVDVIWYWRKFGKTQEEALAPGDCVSDYLRHAAPERRSPNLAFDEFWYRHEYPAVERLISEGKYRSAWEHYVAEGARNYYNPAFWFDDRWYQRQHVEVASAVASRNLICGFEHYLLYGVRQGFSPSIYFNAEWYRKNHMPEITAGVRSYPLVHYLLSERKARACPVPFFDPQWYSIQYGGYRPAEGGKPEVAPAYEHYMLFGRRLGNSPSPYFNEAAYREAYPEVVKQLTAGVYASGFEHYVTEGPANGYLAPSHLGHGGVDYAGPAFLQSYEQSLRLHLSQLSELSELMKL